MACSEAGTTAGLGGVEMPERDWQKDWEMVQEARNGNWWRAEYSGKMLDALPYWLQWVRELEAENRRLKAVAEAAREFLYGRSCEKCSGYLSDPAYCMNCPPYYSEAIPKLREALAALEEADTNAGTER